MNLNERGVSMKKKKSLADLVHKLKAIKASDLMSSPVITTREDVPLSDVAELLIKKRINGMPVVKKNKKLVGIITADDLFMVIDMIMVGDVVEKGKVAVSGPTVKFAMSSETSSVTKNTSLYDILSAMKYKNLHTLPVVEKGKVVGVIGRHDIYKRFYALLRQLGM
jgi:CBS domain-containing protein